MSKTISFEGRGFSARLAEANDLADNGDLDGAHLLGLDLNALAPNRPSPMLLLARIAELRDGPAQKAALLAEFIRQGVGKIAVKRELAQVLLKTEEFSQARALAETLVATGDANLRDRMVIARSYLGEGNLDKAEAHAEIVREQDPNRPGPMRLLATIAGMRGGSAQKAELLAGYIGQGVNDLAVKRELAQAHLKAGEFSQARALAEALVAAGDANSVDRMTIARSYFGEGNLDKAESLTKEARQLAPTRPGPVLFLANISHLKYGVQHKAEVLRSGLADLEDDLEDDLKVRIQLAKTLGDLGDIDGALEVKNAIDLDRCTDLQLFALSNMFEMCRNREGAERCIRHIDPTGDMGSIVLLSDVLNGKIDAETALKLHTNRDVSDGSSGQALHNFCRAKIDHEQVADTKAFHAHLTKLMDNCEGGQSYFLSKGISKTSQPPLVSIVAPIHRAADQDNLIRQLVRQDYPNLEAVIMINGPEIDENALRVSLSECENYKRVHIDVLPDTTSLPKVLNTGFSAATGAFIARFDADDLYFDRYISRSIDFMTGMAADICGKQQIFLYLEELGCACIYGKRYAPIASLDQQTGSGSTLIVSREVIETIKFDECLAKGEDPDFYQRSWHRGFRTVFAPPFDHLVIRKADKSDHTWSIGDLNFLLGSEVDGFLSFCSQEGFEKLLEEVDVCDVKIK